MRLRDTYCSFQVVWAHKHGNWEIDNELLHPEPPSAPFCLILPHSFCTSRVCRRNRSQRKQHCVVYFWQRVSLESNCRERLVPHLQTAVPVLPTGKGDPCWLLGADAGVQSSPLCCIQVGAPCSCALFRVQMLKHMYPISGASLNAVGNVWDSKTYIIWDLGCLLCRRGD